MRALGLLLPLAFVSASAQDKIAAPKNWTAVGISTLVTVITDDPMH